MAKSSKSGAAGKGAKPTVYHNYIGGKWIAKGENGTFLNVNPADSSDIVGEFPKGGPKDVDAAISAAAEAQKSWRLVPAPKRGEILKKAGDILVERKEELARVMTREMGKPVFETRGDVQEAIDTAYYMAGEGRRLFGQTTPCEMPNKFGMSVRIPLGVCGLITPWNFPMAIPSWKAFPALIAGNTVVIKPATDTPASTVLFAKALEDAGLPAGCVNVVCGGGGAVGTPLMTDSRVRLVSFTGSTEIGLLIGETCGRLNKKCCLEMGGKNAQVVMDDADMDLAMKAALWGAFGTAGQRCTATSRLILHKKIAKKFTEELVAQARGLRIGNGLDKDTQMGPVVNEEARVRILGCIEKGKKEGAKLLTGGAPATGKGLEKGSFLQPTIFGDVSRKMSLFQEEIFGPVLSIHVIGSFEEAIEAINDSAYGLSSSVFTGNVNRAFEAIRDIEAGITYINAPTIGAEIQLPFGGVKGTGNGHRESGTAVLETYTDWKSVYVEYSGKLQRAQID